MKNISSAMMARNTDTPPMTPPTMGPTRSAAGAGGATGGAELVELGVDEVDDAPLVCDDDMVLDAEDVDREEGVLVPLTDTETVGWLKCVVRPVALPRTVVARLLAVPHPHCEYPPSNAFL